MRRRKSTPDQLTPLSKMPMQRLGRGEAPISFSLVQFIEVQNPHIEKRSLSGQIKHCIYRLIFCSTNNCPSPAVGVGEYSPSLYKGYLTSLNFAGLLQCCDCICQEGKGSRTTTPSKEHRLEKAKLHYKSRPNTA